MADMAKESIKLVAGAHSTNITPGKPVFLYGYPFAERLSTGIHDWLLSTALYISDGTEEVVFVANDIIFISKASVARIRKGIFEKTGVPIKNIMIGATHTHSGPVTVDCLVGAKDKVVPKVDKEYLRIMESKIIDAVCNARKDAAPSELGLAVADGTGMGTNRHNPSGPSDMEIPVLVVRKLYTEECIACILVCSMHPTVLHEDSKLISGDFPAFAREILQKKYFMNECPILYFSGAAGNKSPRHIAKDNTFEEAHRIGGIIAKAIGSEIKRNKLSYSSDLTLSSHRKYIDLPKRCFPSIYEAKMHLRKSMEKLEALKKSSGDHRKLRTAEVDWFGAVESLHLSEMSESKALDAAYETCLPAEIQVIKIGDWSFVSWPGEIFVEYALEVKKKLENVFLITLANGELQGYIVTEEAFRKGFYEASNSIFNYTSGQVLVEETLDLLKNG
ncbi:MAG: neutral/alkaline non-lysosomal ceramidase N-terminal domain-containing protein [Cytophagales bacterium]|nr:neutral/alkaline non-lysosomal ceramidase N-terminal domain-containing protein [Cytophagales bacterium]